MIQLLAIYAWLRRIEVKASRLKRKERTLLRSVAYISLRLNSFECSTCVEFKDSYRCIKDCGWLRTQSLFATVSDLLTSTALFLVIVATQSLDRNWYCFWWRRNFSYNKQLTTEAILLARILFKIQVIFSIG